MSERSASTGSFLTAICDVVARLQIPLWLIAITGGFCLVAFLYAHLAFDQPINEDFSVYLQESWNIAHFRPLGDVGVVFKPDLTAPLARQDPLIYPPLLPLLYTPVVALAGFDMPLMLTLQLGVLALSFAIFWFGRARLGFTGYEAAASLALFTLQNSTLRTINDFGSDIPFLPLVLLALLAMEVFFVAEGRQRWIWGALTALAILFAVDLRTVGIVLIPTVIVADFLKADRKVRSDILGVLGTFVGLWLFQQLIVGRTNTYDYIFHYKFFALNQTLHSFFWALTSPWKGTSLETVAGMAIPLLVLLAGIGAWRGIAERRATAIFCVLTLLLLLVLPNFDAGTRYLLPLLFFLGAFVVRGSLYLGARLRLNPHHAAIGAAAVVATTAAFYLAAPGSLSVDRVPSGMASAQTQGALEYLRLSTPQNSVVASSKYRTIHLFTERRTIKFVDRAQKDLTTFLAWCRAEGVSYVVVRHSASRSTSLRSDFSDCPKNPLCAASPDARAVKSYENSDYAIWRVRS